MKTFYELPNGEFGLVDINGEDHHKIATLFDLLLKLKVRKPVNREKLNNIWKNYDMNNVRKYRGWRGPVL